MLQPTPNHWIEKKHSLRNHYVILVLVGYTNNSMKFLYTSIQLKIFSPNRKYCVLVKQNNKCLISTVYNNGRFLIYVDL